MTAYPDLVVKFDRLEPKGDRVLYHRTFIGTNIEPTLDIERQLAPQKEALGSRTFASRHENSTG